MSEIDDDLWPRLVRNAMADHSGKVRAAIDIADWNKLRALLARGERRAASEEEVARRRFELDAPFGQWSSHADAYERGWRDSEAYHAIGTASAAGAGEDDLRPEYDLASLGPGERGKYASDAPREGISEQENRIQFVLGTLILWMGQSAGSLLSHAETQSLLDWLSGTAELPLAAQAPGAGEKP